MEWIDTLWSTIAPYVYMAVSFLVSTGIGAIIGQSIVKKWYAKNSDKNLASTISAQVSNAVVGKNIQVSLETANKKLFKSLENNIGDKLNSYVKQLDLVKELMVPIGKIMLTFKGASEENKELLLAIINKIEESENKSLTVVEESEPVVINIEPVIIKEDLF